MLITLPSPRNVSHEELTQDTQLGYEFTPIFEPERLGVLHLWRGKAPTKVMHCYVDVPTSLLDGAKSLPDEMPGLYQFIDMYRRGDNL
jgi:hypothetical protein